VLHPDTKPPYATARVEKRGSRYNGVADEGICIREIAEAIGKHLDLPLVSVPPDNVTAHFGWMGQFVSFDSPASNKQTREQLGWTPSYLGLLKDLYTGFYFVR
jgi:nucleoside-diphosphate-sugar epimerase